MGRARSNRLPVAGNALGARPEKAAHLQGARLFRRSGEMNPARELQTRRRLSLHIDFH
jgi:hypothetical protein